MGNDHDLCILFSVSAFLVILQKEKQLKNKMKKKRQAKRRQQRQTEREARNSRKPSVMEHIQEQVRVIAAFRGTQATDLELNVGDTVTIIAKVIYHCLDIFLFAFAFSFGNSCV